MTRIASLTVALTTLTLAACQSGSPVEPVSVDQSVRSVPTSTGTGAGTAVAYPASSGPSFGYSCKNPCQSDDWKDNNEYEKNPTYTTLLVIEKPFVEAKFSECTNELIQFEGKIRIEERETTDKYGNVKRYMATTITSFKGVGLVSGRKYTTYQSDSFVEKDPVGVGYDATQEVKIDIIRIGEDGNPCRPRTVPDDFRFLSRFRIQIKDVGGVPTPVIHEPVFSMTCN